MPAPARTLNRRAFLRRTTTATATATPLLTLGFPHLRTRAAESPTLGHGAFRYRVVPGWGNLGIETPVNNCHGLAFDREGHVILFTDHARNNVIIYDKKGRLVHKWGTHFPGAHGLSLVSLGGREVLFLTDLQTHKVTQTTLDGRTLQEWDCPLHTGKYTQADQYRPSWTLHAPEGDFYVLDGYGRDYITHYGADGKFVKIFGGAEGGIVHWGPHGGMFESAAGQPPSLLIAMSDQQHLLRLDLSGKPLGRIPLPGGNPRQIRRHGNHYFVAHLGDNWPKDRDCRGFISVLDSRLRVVANVGGSAPEYGDDGTLRPMRHEGEVFRHPHDLVVDDEQSLYVAQFASGQSYPVKLERL
jgi:hypothetical protein